MTIKVELNSETERRLSAEASTIGMTLEACARRILLEYAPRYATGTGAVQPGDVEKMTIWVSSGMSSHVLRVAMAMD